MAQSNVVKIRSPQIQDLDLAYLESNEGEKIAFGDFTFLKTLNASRVKEVRDIIQPLILDRLYYRGAEQQQ